MLTKGRVIGFVGVEEYDIIIYLTTLLNKIDKKVLLIDLSETTALSFCMKIPQGLDIKEKIAECNGISYTRGAYLREYEEKDTLLTTYDYIFVDYGFKFHSQDLKSCDITTIVTDKQMHHLHRLKGIRYSNKEIYLILKHLEQGDNYLQIKNIFGEKLDITKTYPFLADSVDQVLAHSLQYHKTVSTKKLSIEYRYFLKDFLLNALNLTKEEYKRALKEKKRGSKW